MISVVIPVFNEKESLATLHGELVHVLKTLNEPFEIIFVDDGSKDGSLAELKKLHPVRVIAFSRNFGKSQALQAGFHAAKGDFIITMDGDLQDDPKEIPTFLAKARGERIDLVCGWKQRRRDGFLKNSVSRFANSVTRVLTGTTVHDMNCCYKLYRKEVADALHLNGDMHRYIPSLVATLGFTIDEVPVHHRERKFGVSKYGNFRRFFKSFFDLITLVLLRKFMDRPMHLFGIMGSAFSLAGLCILLYLSYVKLFHNVLIGNRPMLILGVLLVVIGVQLFSSGFLGELVVRQNRNQKLYTIREEVENI